MKPFVSLIVALFIAFVSFGQADSLGFTNKAEAKNLIVNGLKEGKWCVYFEHGDTMSTIYSTTDTTFPCYELTIYRADKPNGLRRVYSNYNKYKLLSECQYLNGELSGKCKIYYSNGNIEEEESYLHGKLEGVRKTYFESFRLKEVCSYHKGAKTGVEVDYYESGNKEAEIPYCDTCENYQSINFDNRHGTEKKYYQSGKLKVIVHYVNGVIQDTAKDFYENGKILGIYPYKDNHLNGAYKKFYDNGALKTEAFFTNGKQYGPDKDYYENGQVKEYTPYNDYGKKDGTGKSYFESGKIEDSVIYKNGDILWETIFYESGTASEEVNHIRDKDGYWYAKNYFQDGKLSRFEKYLGYKLVEEFKYDESGNIINK